MEIADVNEAATRLARLVDQALGGEEVILAREGRPAVRLTPIEPTGPPRVGGQWHGRVRIAEDFDELPSDIADAFGSVPT